MSIFPQEWSHGAPKIDMFEILYVLKWKSWFTLGLNTAENTNYIKNALNKNRLAWNFLQKVL